MKREFLKTCLEKMLDKMNTASSPSGGGSGSSTWSFNVLQDILAVIRNEFNVLVLPYLIVLGVYTIWLLVLMICNTYLLWHLYRGRYFALTNG